MAEVPEAFDMRDALWGVEHTGQIPMAPSSTVATLLSYHLTRMKEPASWLSTMFIHYNARIIAGKEGQDAGTTIEDAIKAVMTYGACPIDMWPFDEAKAHVKPPAHVYDAAKKLSKIRYFDPADVCEAVSMKYPVAFAALMPRRILDEAGRTGTMPAPTDDEMKKSPPNHAMVLVGYDKRAGMMMARNCWGTAWGIEKGHCRIPVDVFKAIAPYHQRRLWVIATPESATKDVQSAAAPVAAPPLAVQPAPLAAAETMAEMAAKMKEEIRSSLKKDFEESQKRIRDMMKKPGQP